MATIDVEYKDGFYILKCPLGYKVTEEDISDTTQAQRVEMCKPGIDMFRNDIEAFRDINGQLELKKIIR